MPQLQHYMQVAMMDRAYLSVIFGNMRYEWCEIQYDNEYIKMLYEMESTFWYEHVIKDKEPENIKAEKNNTRLYKQHKSKRYDSY